MAYVSPANDVSQAASKQSGNGRDGEKLDRKARRCRVNDDQVIDRDMLIHA
jgi:hypothetical protein